MIPSRRVDALPERFGKYHVLGRIAQGGMAEIYKVKTVGIAGFEKVQALKRILPAQARDGRFIRSFIDEARIAVELNHRNIVQVFDFGKAGTDLYLAMELIEGKDLKSALAEAQVRRLPAPMPVAAYVITEIAAGLDYAHRKTDLLGAPLHIVHCDVSPANVMLSFEGFVKILDFGIARASFAGDAEKRLRGKPRYMAPEQTRGEPPGAATDVFALGIVAWELLAGRPLFDGPDLPSILAAVRRADAPPLDHVNVAVPPALAEAVARALSPDPARRGTAADLAAAAARAADGAGARALAGWLAHLDVLPPPPNVVVERAAPPPRDSFEHTSDTAVSMRAHRPWGLAAPAPGPDFAEPTATATEPGAVTRTPVTAPSRLDDLDPATVRSPWRGEAVVLEDIDDDLGAPEVALLRERRRAVIVALLVDGASPEARGALARTLTELAYKRGGVLLAVDDAGAVVAFGLEIAGEDDVATAVAFAVDASGAAREAQAGKPPGDAAMVRIGARAGVGIQPDLGGAHRVPADAIDEARALAREAQPGRPLLGGGAGRLSAAHFAFREVPARRTLHRKVRVHEVLGPRSFDERDRALLARRGRFVGRAAALAELDARLDAVIAGGTPQRMLIRGPVGVGKSRLVAEFVARALARPAVAPRLVATAATPATTPLPFGLVVELVQAWLGLPPGRGRDARAQLAGRLARVLGRTRADRELATEAVAAIDAAMELRDGAAVAEAADLPARVARALALVRAHLPGGRPQIVVIEDLHLADGPSLDVLRTGRGEGGAELLLATSRPEPTHLPRFDAVIELGDLVGGDLRALVVDRLGDAASPVAVAAVIARAGGNPLFVEEVAAAIREQGEDEVPATARDVIAARVDRLSPPAKSVLQYAAVAGAGARARILEELVGIGDLAEPLEELCAEGLLVRADDAAPEAGEGDLAFARGLVREVVYDNLAAGARRDAHARVGKLLAMRFFAGREEPPAVIAEHLEQGGELAGAAAFWIRAGRLALAADDGDGAFAAFERALALEGQLGVEPPTAASRVRRREASAGRTASLRLTAR